MFQDDEEDLLSIASSRGNLSKIKPPNLSSTPGMQHKSTTPLLRLMPTVDIPYSGYFSRGNIFVKVVILAISWKKFCGRARSLR